MLLSYKPLHLEAQQCLQEDGCVVDITHHKKMELRAPHMLHLLNIFHENKDSDNCAKVLEEECIRMFGTKSLYDETLKKSACWENLH